MKQGDYYGLPTVVIQSPHLRLEALALAGPRIIRLCLSGPAENLLAETPTVGWDTPRGFCHLYGGHRLWIAPDAAGRNDLPDDIGVTVEPLEDGLRTSHPPEVGSTVAESVDIRLDAERPALTLRHRLRNDGPTPIELAPWAITQLPLGGVAFLPQPTSPFDSEGLTPNRSLALWPYARWHDTRLHIHDDCILVRATPGSERLKIGCLNTHGWIAYQRGETLFVKRSAVDPAAHYPDLGCNVEVYLDDRHIELETLALLRLLEPQAGVEHVERWELDLDLESLPGGAACGRAASPPPSCPPH